MWIYYFVWLTAAGHGILTAAIILVIGQSALKKRVREYFTHHIRKSTANFRTLEKIKRHPTNPRNRVVPREIYAIELQDLWTQNVRNVQIEILELWIHNIRNIQIELQELWTHNIRNIRIELLKLWIHNIRNIQIELWNCEYTIYDYAIYK